MGTRPGDLDPGLVVYLLDHGYDAERLARLVNHEAGVLALSETTSDMRRLLELRATDPRAALAIDVFCTHARKAIGAFAAVLGGLDTLVFTGGIGEHAWQIRADICRGLEHLGIRLSETRNRESQPVVSEGGGCEVRVITTDEESVIARAARRVAAIA